eukprot:8393474-Pyramimonas_sp.AAC.1
MGHIDLSVFTSPLTLAEAIWKNCNLDDADCVPEDGGDHDGGDDNVVDDFDDDVDDDAEADDGDADDDDGDDG